VYELPAIPPSVILIPRLVSVWLIVEVPAFRVTGTVNCIEYAVKVIVLALRFMVGVPDCTYICCVVTAKPPVSHIPVPWI
jgi:hypothetical protein